MELLQRAYIFMLHHFFLESQIRNLDNLSMQFMKRIHIRIGLAFILLSVFNMNLAFGCVCEDGSQPTDHTVLKPENYSDFPVIFVGEYMGWDAYNLRVFNVVKSYKGLDTGIEKLSLRSEACNFHEKVGEEYLIAAYVSSRDSSFLSYSNCKGSFNAKNFSEHFPRFYEVLFEKNTNPIVDLDNRKLKGLSQVVFNSVNYDFKLRDLRGKIMQNSRLWVLFGILALSLILNLYLLFRLNWANKRKATLL
jgi:hypothetical protein